MKAPKIAVVGAGPAGTACAVQLFRYGFNPLIFESGTLGGLLRNANLVENYPGFPGGISGLELTALFKQQLMVYSPRIIDERILHFQTGEWTFKLVSSRREYPVDVLVLATGTRPRPLTGFDIPPDCADRVHYEIADFSDAQDETILIVGAGDAAFDYALNLADQNQVVIINRGETTRSLPLLVERAKVNHNIGYYAHYQVKTVSSTESGLEIECSTPKGKQTFIADRLIGAVGRTPNTTLLEDHPKTEIIALQNKQQLFMIGDVKNGIFRQTSIAVADGVRAAMQIYQSLLERSL